MRGRGLVALAALIVAAACAAPPATIPGPDRFVALDARIERSWHDSEAVVGLAVGRWAAGDETAALELLTEANRMLPGEPAYAAALGLAYDRLDEHGPARDQYLRFLATAGRSELGERLSRRLHVARHRTAGPIALRLVQEGASLQHGMDPQFTVSLPMLTAPPDDADLQALAAATTELLAIDLVERGLTVLDWELSEALLDHLDPERTSLDPAGGVRPTLQIVEAMARALTARGVVLGRLTRLAGDSVAVELTVSRISDASLSTPRTATLTTSLDGLPEGRGPMAARVWELLLGADEGAAAAVDENVGFVPPTGGSTGAMTSLGRALLAVRAEDLATADSHLAAAAVSADLPAITNRRREVADLVAFDDHPAFPLAEELIDFTRRRASAVALNRSAGDAGVTLDPGRVGVGELFGLDRVGAQVFFDLYISTGGPGGR